MFPITAKCEKNDGSVVYCSVIGLHSQSPDSTVAILAEIEHGRSERHPPQRQHL